MAPDRTPRAPAPTSSATRTTGASSTAATPSADASATAAPGSRTSSAASTSPPTPSTGVAAPVEQAADPGALSASRSGWRPVRPPVVSTGSAARFAERTAQRRWLARRRLLIGSGVAVALALAAWALFFSPLLALDVERLELRGQGTVVDVAAVTAVVAAHDRTPLPSLDTVALRREVLDVPGVRAAEVARLWPHGLRITVVSREPVAAVPEPDGFALLDVDGVQVGRADIAPEGLPVVSVPRDDPEARAMTAVLTVLQQLPPELAAEVVAASADTRDTVAFGLSDGATVEWGSPDDSALKARVLATLRASSASAGAQVFDVSAPTLPITRS